MILTEKRNKFRLARSARSARSYHYDVSEVSSLLIKAIIYYECNEKDTI